MKRAAAVASLALVMCGAVLPQAVSAQSTDDKWQFQAIVYAFLPSVGGSTTFPQSGGPNSINVGFDSLFDDLNFAFMGTFDARRGRVGLFTDFIYLDISGSESGTRNFSLGNVNVPAGVSANLDLGLKGVAWTLAGYYRLASDPGGHVDVLAGARLLDIQSTLNYGFSADVGPFAGPGRSGTTDVDESYWDAIVGLKGRWNFGANREWFLPYYVDVGAGQSKLTWQAFGGLGYQFRWGSVLAGWRYLDYEFDSGSKINSIDFNGPMVGVAFNW